MGHLSHQCQSTFSQAMLIFMGLETKSQYVSRKRMTRGNLIPASNYLSSQSPEECQETTKTEVYVSMVQYKEIFALVFKDMSFKK